MRFKYEQVKKIYIDIKDCACNVREDINLFNEIITSDTGCSTLKTFCEENKPKLEKTYNQLLALLGQIPQSWKR